MNLPAPDESLVERVVAMLSLAVFWCAFAALGAGLGLWLHDHSSYSGALLLMGGMLGLLLMPLLRLAAALVDAVRERDRLTFAATLAVLGILCALTIRDAARLR